QLGHGNGSVPARRLLPSWRRLFASDQRPCENGFALWASFAAKDGLHRHDHGLLPRFLSGDAPRRRHIEHAIRDRIPTGELHLLRAASLAHQDNHDGRHLPDAPPGHRHFLQGPCPGPRRGSCMSYELITLLMFSSLMVMLLTGQRVFGAIGFVAAGAALLLWGDGASEMPFNASFQVLNWYPLLTLPLFIFMGYMMAESGIANDLYRMFHVWMGRVRGGLALGTIFLMVIISAMNGLSVAGMAIGASVALPELLRRGYDKVMVTGVIQAGSSLGILIPPSVVLVLYAMIARQPVLQLWLAGIGPGLLMAAIFTVYIYIRCRLQPELAPAMPEEERARITPAEKWRSLGAGLLPLAVFAAMMASFMTGITSLVESAALGAAAATLAALFKRRLSGKVMEDTLRKTLAISCMFMWIILAALCFGAVFDGLGAVRAIESF